jgi:uncharacterized protein (TIGR03437 family)
MQEGFVRTKALLSLFAGIPIVLLAFTTTPFIRRAGAPFDDNGATCLACHQVSATLPGSVGINVTTYTPGVTQLIHVTINDPQGVKWGFQMTARSLNDTTQEAGTFTPVDPSLVTVRCDDGTATGSAAPCNGTREFAQHARAPAAPGAGFTFDVNWTAPPQEVGNIVFYVAALAANGDNTTAGDRTYTAAQLVPLDPAAACSNTKIPNLQRVIDAAAFGNNLASGGLWTIKGLDFETSNLKRTAGPGDFVNNAFPNVLGCIAVEVNGQRTPITYVQTDQINFQGPVVSGPVNVMVVSNAGKPNELRSNVASVTVLPVAPAFFTFKTSNSIAAQFANTPDIVANPAVVPGARPARPGDIVTLYGTGFGATDPPVAVGALATGISNVTTTPLTVTIGGVTLASSDVFYAGLSPGSIGGLYQLNVRIPPTAPDGDIPVVVSVAGIPSQSGATIPVKSVQ